MRYSFLILFVPLLALAQPNFQQQVQIASAGVAASVSGPLINADFDASNALSSWSVIRPTSGGLNDGWSNIGPNPGQLTITNLHSTDGDAGITYSATATATRNQWIQFDAVTQLSLAGDQIGPAFRIKDTTATPDMSWVGYVVNDDQALIQLITGGTWNKLITGYPGGFALANGHYFGMEALGPDSNCIVRIYDNGTTPLTYGTWGAPKQELYNQNLSNAVAGVTFGKYVGLWYGDGGARTKPADVVDNYTADDIGCIDYDKTANFTGTSDPLTASYTCDGSAKLLILGIVVGAGSARTGGAPTYNSVAMTQADSTRTGTETSTELWYLIDPTAGSSQTISVPNTGAATLWVKASSYLPPPGRSIAFDTATGNQTSGANPSVSITPTVNGALIYAVLGDGANAAPSAQSWNNINRTAHSTYSEDNQYNLLGQARASSATWTVATGSWGMCVAAFKVQ